jgi:hypothetical protein
MEIALTGEHFTAAHQVDQFLFAVPCGDHGHA